MSKNISVGSDVLAYCSRCKLNLSATIVSLKEQVIYKVQCNTCKATHRFKDPSQAKKAKSKASTTSKRKKAVPVAEQWNEAMNSTSAESQPYSIKTQFELGDIIEHPKFGAGRVESIVDDKIEVLFSTDVKLLVHNK